MPVKKHVFLLLLMPFWVLPAKAQIFNTASTLEDEQFAFGLNPAYRSGNIGFYFHGGYGLTEGVDAGIHYGFLPDKYFGLDMEWQLIAGKPALSLTTGFHVQNGVGGDLMFNASYPFSSGFSVYTGFDFDLNYYVDAGNISFLYWFPVGVEILQRKYFSIILEMEVPLNPGNYYIFGGGTAFYF